MLPVINKILPIKKLLDFKWQTVFAVQLVIIYLDFVENGSMIKITY